MVKEKANEIELKMGTEFVFEWLASVIQAVTEHHMASHWWRKFSCRAVKASEKWHENVTPIIKQCQTTFLTWMKWRCFIKHN
jgi:hypothetical protein